MISLNNIFVSYKKYILIILIFISFIFVTIGPVELMLGFFYFKNGKSISLNSYKINIPFLHWSYFGESKITYVVTGKNIDSHNLSAEFFKYAEKLNILHAISDCDTVKKQRYAKRNIKGNIYLCTKSKIETMYFQSDDKKILIRENDYNSSNENVVEEYELLLNSITPI